MAFTYLEFCNQLNQNGMRIQCSYIITSHIEHNGILQISVYWFVYFFSPFYMAILTCRTYPQSSTWYTESQKTIFMIDYGLTQCRYNNIHLNVKWLSYLTICLK